MDRMSIAWRGLRAVRNVLMLGALALCVYLVGGAQRPRVGYVAALAGVPVNRTAPTITGDHRLGGVLTCSRGTWDEPEGVAYPTTYQWVRDNADLAGQTNADYTVTAADIGRGLRCDVMATGTSGSTEASSVTLFPRAPQALIAPRVSGDLRPAQTLTCSRGTWDDDGVPAYATSFTWLRDGQSVAGRTAATYALAREDVGHGISCRVSVGTLANSTSNGVVPAAPVNRALPAISGDLRLGGTLTCSRGTWNDEGIAPYAVTKKWLRDGAELLGAEGDEYTVRLADVNHAISCRVRAADQTDSTSASVSPTAPTQRSQPAIEGDPRLGRTLTCTRGTWDDNGRGAGYEVGYEWYRNSIHVADGANFTVTAIDVGKSLQCRVVVEGLTTVSSPSLSVPQPDSLTVPTLTGDARLGRSLRCTRGTWDDADVDPYPVTYQWLRNGTPIEGANTATYAITADDVNRGLSCRVIAAGLTTATSAATFVQPPESFLAPRVEGDPRVGADLTCSRGDWDDPAAAPYAVSYQWYRAGTQIADATAATYRVAAGDVNQFLQCRVRAADLVTASSPSALITPTPPGGAPTNLITPAISGDRRLRHALTCSRGSWNDTSASRFPVTYRWRRNSVTIVGATTSSYTITTTDVGQTLSCDVTAAGQATAQSPGTSPTAPELIVAPALSGDPRLRQALSCSRGTWHDDAADRYAVTYRWLRNGTAITGATTDTYTLTAADVGTGIACEVRAEALTAANSGGIGVTAPRVVLGPVLAGNPRLLKTLSCSRGTWDDVAADRYGVTYQWLRDSQPIGGQTAATYSVTAADTGHSLTCIVRAEALTSASPINGAESVRAPLNRSLPRLSGHPRLRQALSCSRGDWDDEAEDRYAVAYQWLRNGTAIAGATAAAYTITADDVNTFMSCRVRAEDLTNATSASQFVSRPDNVLAPALSGPPHLYRTLSCSRGDWDDTPEDRYAVTYSWLRNGTPIPGATAPTYTLQRDDVARSVHCRVRAEGFVDANSGSVFVFGPEALMRPALSGQPHLRGELTCTRGTWDDTPEKRYAVSYQWYRNGVPINGATDPSYVVGAGDFNRSINCSATAEVLTESFAGSVFVPAPRDTVLPRIEGIAHPRRELTCTRGEWNDSADRRYVVSYQWRRNNVNIAGADGAHHVVVAEDVGAFLTCTVTAEGAHTAVSASIVPTWEPLRLSVTPDLDATGPAASNAYTLRLRNDNPVPVTITQLDLTLPGGFSYRVERSADGSVKRTVTDGAGRRTELVVAPDGVTTITRPGGTRVTQEIGPDPRFGMQAPVNQRTTITTPSGLRTTFEGARTAELFDPSDPLSLRTLVETSTVNGRTHTTRFAAAARRFTSSTPSGRTSTTDVDVHGRPTRAEVPGMATVLSTYDSRGRLTQTTQGTRTTSYTYDARGRVSAIADPLSRTTQFAYDLGDRIAAVQGPDGRQVAYGYDGAGNVLSITPPGRSPHAFAYSSRDLLARYTPPQVGSSLAPTSYAADRDTLLTAVTRPGGGAITFAYDASGRLERVTQPRGSADFGYADPSGNLTTATAPGGERVSYGYDGGLQNRSTASGTVAGEVTAAYDADLRLAAESVNGGLTAAYGYDQDGLLTGAAGMTIARGAEDGIVDSMTLGGTTTTLAVNAHGEPESVTTRQGSTPLYGETFGRDNLGRLTARTETRGAGGTSYVYTYDAADRLSQVTRDGALQATYSYDANGNRTQVQRAGELPTTAEYDAQDRLTRYGPNTYTYTDGGELRTKQSPAGTSTYDYDSFGALTRVALPDGAQVDYTIDAGGRRIAVRRNGVLQQGFLYGRALGPAAELNADGTVKSRFIYATRDNVPDIILRDGKTYRVITDVTGSPRAVVDTSNGSVAQEMDYDEFGRVTRDTNPGFQPFGFAGGLYDRHTGLVRFGLRDYDGETGRFTAPDPILFDGGQPNLYAYVGNDPVNYVDPTGEFITQVIGAATSVLTGWAISKLTGCDYSLTDALVDAGTGALGVGVFNKVRKLSRLSKLRNIAKNAGMTRQAAQKNLERYVGSHYARIDIKHVGNVFSPQGKLNPSGSWIPRARVRATAGTYVDPFTGAVGPLKSPVAHIPLEALPLAEAPAIGAAAGVAGGAARAGCDC